MSTADTSATALPGLRRTENRTRIVNYTWDGVEPGSGPGPVPDLEAPKRPHMDVRILRPLRVEIESKSGYPTLVTVYGHEIRKDGSTSARLASDICYDPKENLMPDWLTKLVADDLRAVL